MKIWISVAVSAMAFSALFFSSSQAGDNFSPLVDSQGNIQLPENFRDDWTHLGSWFVSDDGTASGPGVHDVYTQPETVKAFQETGQWPDGATLVKEIRSIETERMTTGNAQWAGDAGVWFVMIRDNKNRFPDNEAWAESWGWALFDTKEPGKNLTATWKGEGFNNCFGCHIPAKDTDWVFIDGYPSIRDAAHNTSAQ